MDRVHHRNEVSDGPSEAIWGDPELARASWDKSFGRHWFDDFMTFGAVAASQSNVRAGLYRVFTSAGCSMAGASEAGGGVTLTNDSTTDRGSVLAFSGWPINMPGADTSAVSTGKKFAFEARVKFSTVTPASAPNCFVGLLDNAAITAILPVAATETLGAGQVIGFFKGETAGSTIGTYYNDASSVVAIQASELTSAAGLNLQNEALPLVALNTYLKLGMLWDPFNVNANDDNLSFFANGILLDSGLTNKQIFDLTTIAADFLSPAIAQINSSTSAAPTMTMEWWKLAHLL